MPAIQKSTSHKPTPANDAAPKAAPKKPPSPLDAASAYARVEDEIMRLDPSDLVVINIDVPTAVSIVLGALPAVRPLRGDIVDQLPRFPIATLDDLEAIALAAWYAHLTALSPRANNRQIKDLLEEATPLRATLLSDADALARRGLVPAATVADIRAGQGHIDTANDLVALAALFSSSWPEIHGKTAATEDEVRRAAQLGPQLLAALGVRDQGRIPSGEAPGRRARAFSLLVRTYDQIRRAVGYLRWDEDDADSIAPSLYKGRGGRAPADAPSAAPDDEEASAPTTPPAGTGAPDATPEGGSPV